MSNNDFKDNEIFGMNDNLEVGNVNVDSLESDQQTLINFILDESGSMHKYVDTMKSALAGNKNALIDSKQVDEILVAITRFSYSTNISIYGYQQAKDLSNDYTANGYTALYKAIIETARNLVNPENKGYMNTLQDNGINTKAVFVVFSDGQDNENPELLKQAKETIAYLNSKEVITVFIEFGDEAKGIAKALGFKNMLSTDASESELRRIFSLVSKSCIQVSKAANSKAANDCFNI